MSLRISHLYYSFLCHEVLKDVSFQAEDGNLVCLLGCNGAGKSTLLRCILGLLPYRRGNIWADGAEIRSLSVRERARKIAYIPQNRGVLHAYSALEMVLMGTTSRLNGFFCPGVEEKKQAEQALEMLGIAHVMHRSCAQLSGGECQLVLIARAIAQQAKILVLDEPCSSLDFGNQIRVMQRVKMLAEQGYLILMSTHSPEHARLFADRVLVLQNKGIEYDGSSREVITPEVLEQIYGVSADFYHLNGASICG